MLIKDYITGIDKAFKLGHLEKMNRKRFNTLSLNSIHLVGTIYFSVDVNVRKGKR